MARFAIARLVGACVLLASFSALATAVQERLRICPTDEAVGVASLVRFRDELRAAVKARDIEALRPLVSPDIQSGESQEYKSGFEAFVNYNFGREPELASMNWRDIERALSLGGVMEPQGTFCAPFFACPVPTEWEPGEVLVLGTDVPAYARPDRGSPIIERLSCDVLPVAPLEDLGVSRLGLGWEGVLLKPGTIGFVEERFLKRPGLYLRIGRQDGKWVVIAVFGAD